MIENKSVNFYTGLNYVHVCTLYTKYYELSSLAEVSLYCKSMERSARPTSSFSVIYDNLSLIFVIWAAENCFVWMMTQRHIVTCKKIISFYLKIFLINGSDLP